MAEKQNITGSFIEFSMDFQGVSAADQEGIATAMDGFYSGIDEPWLGSVPKDLTLEGVK